jgi:hypothetical protein
LDLIPLKAVQNDEITIAAAQLLLKYFGRKNNPPPLFIPRKVLPSIKIHLLGRQVLPFHLILFHQDLRLQ